MNANGSARNVESGVDTYTFSGNAPQPATPRRHAGRRDDSETVHSTNRAGIDSLEPPTRQGGLDRSGRRQPQRERRLAVYYERDDIALATTPYADGVGSGMAGEVLTVQSAPLAADACGTFGSTSDITGSATYGVSAQLLSLHAHRDRQGRQHDSVVTVKVDTTAPVAPAITFTGLSSGNTFVDGATLFYRPSAGGTFTVNATVQAIPRPESQATRSRRLTGFLGTSSRVTRLTSPSTEEPRQRRPVGEPLVNNAGVSSTPASAVHR